jgi:pimeloyl-ACP methyl ester carboxylesterase
MAIAYERTGEGPALALLHPLGADRRVWSAVVPYLRERRELIIIDLPGFGESPPLSASKPTPRALAGGVAELLRALDLDRPHVAGNSLGGWVALELALAGAVRTATAIAPAGLWPSPLVPKPSAAHLLAARLLPLVGRLAASGPGRRVLLGSAVAHPNRVPPSEAAHLVRAYAQAPGFVAVNNAMRAGRFKGLERIRVPLTLVWPEHDGLVRRPPWLPDNVRNVTLENTGHIPMWDAPERVAEVLFTGSGGTRPAEQISAASP